MFFLSMQYLILIKSSVVLKKNNKKTKISWGFASPFKFEKTSLTFEVLLVKYFEINYILFGTWFGIAIYTIYNVVVI